MKIHFDKKTAFSLAETLIVFLLVSIMLAAFAPSMTKKTKKSNDPSCAGGVKTAQVVYSNPGSYTFTLPASVVGKTKLYIVGAGGAGGNCSASTSGGGGAGGAYRGCEILLSGGNYAVTVGAGTANTNGGNSSFTATYTATGGAKGNGATAGAAGATPASVTGCTASAGAQGTAGGATTGGSGGVNTGAFGTNVNSIKALGGCWGTTSCGPHGSIGADFTRSGLSTLGFYAGFGGGGGGKDNTAASGGGGGRGGHGVVIIEYKIKCN